MWNKIANFILRQKLILLISLAVIFVFMTSQMLKVEMDYHYTNMLPESDSAYINNMKFKETFGNEATGIIVAMEDTNIFELEKFNAIINLCDSIRKIKNITNVLTISDVINLQNKTTIDSATKKKTREFEIYKTFPKKVTSQHQLDSLKKCFFNLPIYEGLLYNQDRNVFLLLITISKDVIDTPERLDIVFGTDEHLGIEKYVKNFEKETGIKTHISGHPYIRSKIMVETKSEILFFTVLAAVICILILIYYFRSFKVILVSLLTISFSISFALGLMGILGYKITILTAMIPPLLIIIGIPNSVYLINKFHNELKFHGNKILALQRVITKVGAAVCITNATTAAGFCTFVITQNANLVEFGIISSVGILCILISSLIIIPGFFSYWKAPANRETKHIENKFFNALINKLDYIVFNKRKIVYICFSSVILLSAIGIFLIKRSGYILDDVKHNHPIYLDLKYIESKFKGAFPLEIVIESKDTSTNAIKFVEQIEKIDSLQRRLEKYPCLSKSLSIADATKFLYQAYSKGKVSKYKLPPNEGTYAQIIKRLPKLDNNMAKSFIDSSRKTTRISLYISDIGVDSLEKVLPLINEDLNSIFPKDQFETYVTGSTILYFVSTTYLTTNLLQSLILAIFLIVVFMFWLFRSPRIVLISVIPNLLPMIVTGGIMGYFGIPIKPSTILVFSITFGISVDQAIHFLSKFRQDLTKYNWNIIESVKSTLSETAQSMIYSAIILVFGFMIFAFSNFGGTVALGILITIALFVATFANVILLPSILLSFEKKLSKMNHKEFADNLDEQ